MMCPLPALSGGPTFAYGALRRTFGSLYSSGATGLAGFRFLQSLKDGSNTAQPDGFVGRCRGQQVSGEELLGWQRSSGRDDGVGPTECNGGSSTEWPVEQ